METRKEKFRRQQVQLKKKFGLIMIALLLILQSFSGIVPTSYSQATGDEAQVGVGSDSSAGDEGVEVDDGTTETDESEDTEVDNGSTETDGNEVADSQEAEGSESSEDTEDSTGIDGASDEGESGLPEAVDGEESEAGIDEDLEKEDKVLEKVPTFLKEIMMMSAGYTSTMPDTVITSTKFTVGGQTVSGIGPVTVKNGQKAQFKFNLGLAAGHNYGPDTTLTYTLPDIFTGITFPQGTQFGDLGEITKSGNNITITFNDNIVDDFGIGTAFEPGAHFYIEATFNNTGDNVNETIDLPGQDKIQLNFTPLHGSPITKEDGHPQPSNQNSQYIEWNVKVNTDLSASGTVQFKDTLSATNGSGHTFDINSATITELTMKPDGTVLSTSDATLDYIPSFNGTNTVMTIDLDGTKAYEITYHTIPDDPGNNENVVYLNGAKYGSSNVIVKNATVNYGTPLRKSGTLDSSTLETTWTIEYNHNKRTILESDAVLIDSWSTSGGSSDSTKAQQEMVAGSFEVSNGDGNKVSNYTLDHDPGDQGFTLQFDHDVTDAYTITYKTKPTDDTYITSDMTVTNTVTRSDIGIERSPSVTYYKTTFMLNKTAGSVDYENKTIPWTITANQAGYNLAAGTKFVDTFTNTNMTLKEETLVVNVGGISLEEGEGKGYRLTNNGKTGFTIELTNSVNRQVVITYTTDYDIKDVGSNNRTFNNQVVLTDSGLPATPSHSATRSVDGKQTANGKKDGKYNYATKKFEWEVELNFNYNTLTDANFEDVLPDTQTIDNDSITVVKGTLNSNGVFQEVEAVTVTNTATEPNKINLALGKITQPYKVIYTSHDTDGVFPETAGKVQITNNATLKDGITPNASWTKTVGVNYTDKLITKKGSQLNGTAGIKWNFEFNYAQSNLRNVIITDTVGKDVEGNPNQLIKPDSLKVYQVALSGKSDSATYTVPKHNTLLPIDQYTLNVNIQAGTFELKLPDGDKAYYIEYETIYIGDNGSTVENAVQVNYESSAGTQASNNYSISNFSYGNAGTTVKVPFVVVKTDGSTGEPMADVEFTLYSKFQPGVALISKKTDAAGIFDLGMKLTEGEYTLEETTVSGYDNPGPIKFDLHRDSVAKSGPHTGKQIVEIENYKIGSAMCMKFTVTIKDVDRNVVANKNVKFTNKATGQTHTVATNNEGKVDLAPDPVKAGIYTVTMNEGGTEVTLGDITVAYHGDCQNEYELQPAPKCDRFTITIEDKDTKPRPNVTVTLKHKTDNNAPEIITTTDANGKFTVPSVTTQTGEYKIYEGKQFLGEVKITYKNNPCEATVIEAPTCERFTLIVKDVDGQLVPEGTSITIKDKDGNVIEANLTTIADGKVTTTVPLPAGEYKVYEADSNEPFAEFVSNPECQAEVQPAPACTDFTITVNAENGDPRSEATVTVKDQTGNEITAKPTDVNGKIQVPSKDLPAGTYDIYEGEVFLGKVPVSYKNGCMEAVDTTVQNAGTCPKFALIIQNSNGTPKAKLELTIKDSTGNTVVTSMTDEDGKIILSNSIKQGTYDVYVKDSKFGSFTVKDTCSAIVKEKPSSSSGGGGGGGPLVPEPNKPPTTTTGKVVDEKTGEITKGIEVKITKEPNGKENVSVKTEEAIVIKHPDGSKNTLKDTSKLSFTDPETTDPDTGDNKPPVNVTITEDGTIQVEGLENNTETTFNITYDLGNGEKIIIGKIQVSVSSDGDVSVTSSLIDPYGIITDEDTGEPIPGVYVELFYADTERNRANGKTPDTLVSLPKIDGFEPNDNASPQFSDPSGSYAFMVYPNTDYYIVTTKDGYKKYISPTISVELEIVEWDIQMKNENSIKIDLPQQEGTTNIGDEQNLPQTLEKTNKEQQQNINQQKGSLNKVEKQKLPQTGEKQTKYISLIGLLFIGVAFISFIIRKRLYTLK